jgi:hypothetical protein
MLDDPEEKPNFRRPLDTTESLEAPFLSVTALDELSSATEDISFSLSIIAIEGWFITLSETSLQ